MNENMLIEKIKRDRHFLKVMEHIFFLEGGYSNHPNDSGGKTYRGITEIQARKSGFKGDVRDLNHDQVLFIYYKNYWSPRASKYQFPLSLAVMNTEVNSGARRAIKFLNALENAIVYLPTIPTVGLLNIKSRWFVDQQAAFYLWLVSKNPKKYKVFLKGWLNRCKYLRKVIDSHSEF